MAPDGINDLAGQRVSATVCRSTGVNLTGRACVFNAPKGASFDIAGEHIFGHVGWAYLINRNTGMWEFGANEGPKDNIYGFPSKTWLAEATWAELIQVFSGALPGGSGTNKNYYHKAGYYKTYRCVSTTTNHSTAANAIQFSMIGTCGRCGGAWAWCST